MIGVQVAQQLRETGLTWKPSAGDRFAIPDRDLDDEIFVLSHMTIEVHNMPEGRVIGFNGTTEWALDDVEIEETIWLPREDQLRELLGAAFHRLERAGDRYRVVATVWDEVVEFVGDDPCAAYGEALLHLLAGGRSVPGAWDAPPA